MTFTENLIQKLNPAVEAKLIDLPALEETGNITTANTLTTLFSYNSPKLTGFDIIEFGYVYTVNNNSGNNEDMTDSLDLGNFGSPWGIATTTVADGGSVTFYLTGRLVKMAGENYMISAKVVEDANNTVTELQSYGSITDLTQILLGVQNNSTASAGLTIEGLGGYILLDQVNRV